jgi:hypothetical protein
MKKLPLYLRIGMAVLGQNKTQKPNFDELLKEPELNPQKTTSEGPGETTQSAQIWTSIQDDKPTYYKPISIRVGNKVIDKIWARVSDGEKDYYVNNDDDRVIDKITHWSDLTVTPENVDPVIKLRNLIHLIEENYLPLDQVLGFNRERSEGYNHGIGTAVDVLEREIQRLTKDNPIHIENKC